LPRNKKKIKIKFIENLKNQNFKIEKVTEGIYFRKNTCHLQFLEGQDLSIAAGKSYSLSRKKVTSRIPQKFAAS